MDQTVDHRAREDIRVLTAEMAKMAAVVDGLIDRVDREGTARTDEIRAQTRALEELAKTFADTRISDAFLKGKNTTRWATIGFAVSFGFMVLGGLASALLHRALQ